VTGASRGIGRAIAIRLGSLGATVVVHHRASPDAAGETARSIAEAGGRAHVVQADLACPDSPARLAESLLAYHGRVDILVHNAAVQRSGLLHELDDARWDEVFAVNVHAAFKLCRSLLPAMLAARWGRIVQVASASAYMGQRGASPYVASKCALVGLTRALAAETAGKGILVNAVAPGLTDTDMLAGLTDAQRAGLLAVVPLRRVAHADEIANLVAFVVTDATYSTGNVFHASGGAVMI
jgi:3-oxoacyl-[acyl-carrier protein] reductase